MVGFAEYHSAHPTTSDDPQRIWFRPPPIGVQPTSLGYGRDNLNRESPKERKRETIDDEFFRDFALSGFRDSNLPVDGLSHAPKRIWLHPSLATSFAEETCGLG